MRTGGNLPRSDGPPASRRVPFGILFEVEVVSSDGQRYYHVRQRADGTWDCDCPGFRYQEHCKHIYRERATRGVRSIPVPPDLL